MKTVDLGMISDSHFIGLVIPCKSGILWTSQTGGGLCAHPKVEGVFIPLPAHMAEGLERHDPLLDADVVEYDRSLIRRFLATCEFMDLMFEPIPEGVPLPTFGSDSYDSDVLTDGRPYVMEAWVPVRVKERPLGYWATLARGFEGQCGFITYVNSD